MVVQSIGNNVDIEQDYTIYQNLKQEQKTNLDNLVKELYKLLQADTVEECKTYTPILENIIGLIKTDLNGEQTSVDNKLSSLSKLQGSVLLRNVILRILDSQLAEFLKQS